MEIRLIQQFSIWMSDYDYFSGGRPTVTLSFSSYLDIKGLNGINIKHNILLFLVRKGDIWRSNRLKEPYIVIGPSSGKLLNWKKIDEHQLKMHSVYQHYCG